MGGREPPSNFFLLTFRASVDCLCQKGLKIVDMKVNMNWRPVSFISTNFVSSLGWIASSRFFDQSDLGVPTFENDVSRHRPSDFGKILRRRDKIADLHQAAEHQLKPSTSCQSRRLTLLSPLKRLQERSSYRAAMTTWKRVLLTRL